MIKKYFAATKEMLTFALYHIAFTSTAAISVMLSFGSFRNFLYNTSDYYPLAFCVLFAQTAVFSISRAIKSERVFISRIKAALS